MPVALPVSAKEPLIRNGAWRRLNRSQMVYAVISSTALSAWFLGKGVGVCVWGGGLLNHGHTGEILL